MDKRAEGLQHQREPDVDRTYPVYYQRILNYVKLKYRKRYLLTKQ